MALGRDETRESVATPAVTTERQFGCAGCGSTTAGLDGRDHNAGCVFACEHSDACRDVFCRGCKDVRQEVARLVADIRAGIVSGSWNAPAKPRSLDALARLAHLANGGE